MKILWFSWKDIKNPRSGGAELVTHEITKRLVAHGHSVTLLTARFKGGKEEEHIDGVHIIRLGDRWTVYWYVFRYYRKNFRGRYDLIIDEINTIPFFTPFFVQEPVIVFVHQLARTIWFYEMWFIVACLGWILEPLYLFLYRKIPTITISHSTKQDLQRLGFHHVFVISEGIDIDPLDSLPRFERKEKDVTLLYLGSMRRMKRPDHVIKAFHVVVQHIPNAKLWIAGRVDDPQYVHTIFQYIHKYRLESRITVFGRISKKEKIHLLQQATLLIVTSVREGWCLTVTEANALGTPAVVYNVSGLRDSVKNGETGIICHDLSPQKLGEHIVRILMDHNQYRRLRINAWQWSKKITFPTMFSDFLTVVQKIV